MNPFKDDNIRLRHMLDYAQKAVQFTKGRSRADLDTDEMLALAVIHLIEIIGEASRSVSEEFRGEHPEIPWEQISGPETDWHTATSMLTWTLSGQL